MKVVSGIYWASFRSETLPKFASPPHMHNCKFIIIMTLEKMAAYYLLLLILADYFYF